LPYISAVLLPERPFSVRRSHSIGIVITETLRVLGILKNLLFNGIVKVFTVKNIRSLQSDIQMCLVNMGSNILSVRNIQRLNNKRIQAASAGRNTVNNVHGSSARAPQSISGTTHVHHNIITANIQRTIVAESVHEIRFHRVAIDVNSMSFAVT
jgi:hypothetical protein